MENLANILKNRIPKKKGYPVTDAILEIVNLTGVSKGLVFKLWQVKGNETIFKLLSEIKQGEVKYPRSKILGLLKK